MQKHEKSYLVAFAGVVLTLLWLGVFKFTEFEANAIRPLIESHPLMSWTFKVMSVQAVSNIIGSVEIIVALGMIMGLWVPRIAYWSGWAAVIIFLTTLSFLLTTAKGFSSDNGMLVPNFFLFKDLVFLGVALMSIERSRGCKLAS